MRRLHYQFRFNAESLRYYRRMSETVPPSLTRRIWMRIFAATGVIAAVVASYWIKVDDARQPEEPPATAFGQPVDTGRALLTPRALFVLPADPGDPGVEPGTKLLALTARIENITGQTQSVIFASPPRVEMGDLELAEPKVILDRDGEALQQLQPRLPEDVTILWTLPETWQAQQVEITFFAQIFKLRDNLYGQSNWLGTYPAGSLLATPGISS